MAQFIIDGGKPLAGTIAVAGMKNAATPILAATILTSEECVIDNVPQITDVQKMLEILRSLGAQIQQTGNRVVINCRNLTLNTLDKEAVKSMRSSILLLGPLLARFKQAQLPEPGGCIIGNRPLDAHLTALQQLGAEIARQDGVYDCQVKKLKGAVIVLPEFSVTATENALMAAALAEGKTIIKLAAAEPHVQDLIKFLNTLGAKIRGAGTHTLEIEGVDKLGGGQHRIIPDQIETGTFAALAAATRSEIKIENIVPEHLDIILLKLKEIGADFELGENYLMVKAARAPLKSFKFQAMPYPGLPTDLQQPFGLLATQCQGTSLIQDPLYEGRLGYISELIKMGANAVVCDPHRVLITGPTPLYGQEIKGLDLRAGITLVIAGLVAQGQTIINSAEIVDRGYERIEERLKGLGAQIRRVD